MESRHPETNREKQCVIAQETTYVLCYSTSPSPLSLLSLQDFCTPEAPFPPANSSSSKLGISSLGSPGPQFVLLPNSSALTWAPDASAPSAWPPLSSLRLLASQEGQSCVEACQRANLVCEPALFRFVNNKEALRG